MPFARNGSLCSRTQHLFRVHARQGERRQGSRKNHGERGKSNGCGKSGRIGAQIEEHGKVRLRSEERRVGKECRSRGAPDDQKKKMKRREKTKVAWITQ